MNHHLSIKCWSSAQNEYSGARCGDILVVFYRSCVRSRSRNVKIYPTLRVQNIFKNGFFFLYITTCYCNKYLRRLCPCNFAINYYLNLFTRCFSITIIAGDYVNPWINMISSQ